MSTIYMVELHDYDRNEVDGYLTDYDKAKACCDFNNKRSPSEYEESGFHWDVIEYHPDTTDYIVLLNKLEQMEKEGRQRELQREKQNLLHKTQEFQARINKIDSELSELKGSE